MSQELILYAQPVTGDLPPEKFAGWSLLAKGKMRMDTELVKHGGAQSVILHGYETMTYPALVEALKAYKAGFILIEDTRKAYTRFLDNVKEKCMEVEKAWNPANNEVFKKAVARELELRQAANNEANAAKAKADEVARFTAFVQNEFFDMAAGYRSRLAKVVQDAYTTCLTQRTPLDNINTAITAAVAAMKEVRPREFGKFHLAILTKDEAGAIFASIAKPDYKNIFAEQIKLAQEKFSLYPNDLANAEQALAQQTELFNQQQAEQAQQAEATMAGNTLAATAVASLSVMPTGMKSVTETTEIVLQDFDWAWAAKIIVAFSTNMAKCVEKVRVRKCHSLTVAQMAAALDAANIRVEGIDYQTVKK